MPREDVRVVVVDDDPDTCESLKVLLEMDGYNVRTALSAEQAIALVAEHEPLCVLLDLGLPGLDGLEFARRMRAAYGGDMVLVAVTGRTREEDRMAADAAGIDFVMHKPLKASDLQKLLPPIS
jgi:two-component system CheB/CheR fusion protein